MILYQSSQIRDIIVKKVVFYPYIISYFIRTQYLINNYHSSLEITYWTEIDNKSMVERNCILHLGTVATFSMIMT